MKQLLYSSKPDGEWVVSAWGRRDDTGRPWSSQRAAAAHMLRTRRREGDKSCTLVPGTAWLVRNDSGTWTDFYILKEPS